MNSVLHNFSLRSDSVGRLAAVMALALCTLLRTDSLTFFYGPIFFRILYVLLGRIQYLFSSILTAVSIRDDLKTLAYNTVQNWRNREGS